MKKGRPQKWENKLAFRGTWLSLFLLLVIAVLQDFVLLPKGVVIRDDVVLPPIRIAKKPSSVLQMKPHPYAGARYPNRTYGYVVDVQAVRRHYLDLYRKHLQEVTNHSRTDIHPRYTFFPIQDKDFRTACKGTPGKDVNIHLYNLLMKRVQVNAPDPIVLNVTNTSLFQVNTVPVPPSLLPATKSTVLCIIYTHNRTGSKLYGITSTWGWRCDGFFAASDVTQMDDPYAPNFGSVDLDFLGNRTYGNMWQKTRSIIGYIHENFLQHFDYFFVCGDDTYVVVENLRNYLASVERQHNISTMNTAGGGNRTHDNVPLYLGRATPRHTFRGIRSAHYVDGGGGYVLNRAAIRQFVEKALDSCEAQLTTSMEDVLVGYCFKQMGFYVTPRIDMDSQLRHRFHAMDPGYIAIFAGFHGLNGRFNRLDREFNLEVKSGHDLVSQQSVAFHWQKPNDRMFSLHAILYRACPPGTVLGSLQLAFDQNHTPTPPAELARLEKSLAQA